MTVGEVLAAFGGQIYGLWPVRIVQEWEQGVLTRFGTIRRTLTHQNGIGGTGCHLLWPWAESIETQDTNVEISTTDTQTHTTLDGVPCVFSMTMRYRVTDLGALFRQIHDQDETISNALEACAGRWVPELEWETLDEQLPIRVEQELTATFEGWGIDLEDIALHSCAKVQVFRIFHD